MNSLVITFIADDKPGIVNLLSRTIADHQGNWLESSLSHLGGKFTGILIVELPGDQTEALQAALEKLSEQGLRIFAEIGNQPDAASEMRSVQLELVGQDKPGIVREISAILAQHRVNVLRLATELAPGQMSSELIFRAEGDLQVPSDTDLDRLQTALEAIAGDLMVDINLS